MTYRAHMLEAARDPKAPEILRVLAQHLAQHGDAIAEVVAPATVGEIAARGQLAELAAAVESFRLACEHDPNFAALPGDHPARRLFRTHERVKVADRLAFATMADRILASATRDERAAAALDIANRRTLRQPLTDTDTTNTQEHP